MRKKVASFVVMAIVALCDQCWSQLAVLPTPGKYAGYVSSKEPGGWLVVKDGFTPVAAMTAADKMSVVWEGDAGTYGVIFFTIKDGIVLPQIQQVALGGQPSPPPPPPGSRWVLIIEEPGDRSPQVGNLLVTLRRQPELSKLVQILDKDASAEYVRRVVREIPSGYSFPVIVSMSSDGKPVRIGPLRPTDTIERIKEYLK